MPPLAAMQALAEEILTELKPFCERIEIAGSILRGKPEPKDIELVAVPKQEKLRRGQQTLFDGAVMEQAVTMRDLLHEHLKAQVARGLRWAHRLDKNGRPAFGLKYKRLLLKPPAEHPLAPEVSVDLFCVLHPARFGPIMVIRTGPAEFSEWLATHAYTVGLRFDEGRIVPVHGGEPPLPQEEEADVFRILKLPYMPIAQRVPPPGFIPKAQRRTEEA